LLGINRLNDNIKLEESFIRRRIYVIEFICKEYGLNRRG